MGDDDTFFPKDAIMLLQKFLNGVQNPPARAQFHYGKNKPHCFGPWGAKLVTMMAEATAVNAPAGANRVAWLPAAVAAPRGTAPPRTSAMPRAPRGGR